MKIIFSETGIEEAHELGFEPRAGQTITLIRDGTKIDYIIDSVSGPIYENVCQPTMVRVRLA